MARLVIGTDKTAVIPSIVKEVGITPTGTLNITANNTYDVTNYASVNVNVQAGGKYHLLDRVTDDNNNEIGTVSGFFTDSNNTEYAVVVLDKIYRSSNGFVVLSDKVRVTGLPYYENLSVYEATQTSTFNCDKILEQATASGLTSSGVTECRSHYFTIDGVTYYGQMPGMPELMDILQHRTAINNKDTSMSGPAISATSYYWSSTQRDENYNWYAASYGAIDNGNKNWNIPLLIPILEIPNT